MKFYDDNNELNEIADEVVKLMPSLEPFYRSEETLSQYSKRINNYKPNSIHLRRQTLFKKLLNEKIHSLFNEKELEDIQINLNETEGIKGGIVEHHGVLDHPLLLSVHLVSNFYKLLNKKECGDILTFATGNVSLNEPFRRRGIIYRGRKINLFPKADKNKVVYGLKKYDLDIVKRTQESHQWHLYSKEEQKFLEEVNGIIKNIDFSTCPYLGDQFTKINFYLWPYLFEEKLRKNLANLVVIEYDNIIVDYLIYVLKNEKESFVSEMLFNKEFQNKMLREFEGVAGAWDEEREVGTHFFWAFDTNNERIQLKLKDGWLINEDADYKISLEKESLIAELASKKLLPGMLLRFSLILFYMGMKPFCGYSLEYLTRMKQKMIKVLKNDFLKEAELASEVPLDNMNLISICKGKDNAGDPKDLHAFDIFFNNGFKKEFFEKLDSLPFKNFLIPSLLFAYNYAISKYGDLKEKRTFSVSEKELQKPFEKLFI